MKKDFFKKWIENKTESPAKNRVMKVLTERQNVRTFAVEALASILPTHYVPESTLESRLKNLGFPASAKLLKETLPASRKLRSGDLGEIIATEYVCRETQYEVPIKKLRWKDSRQMSMRGDDFIGIYQPENKPIMFLKGESKSRVQLGSSTVEEIEAALNNFKGRPSSHSLLFVSARLREIGRKDLADTIENALARGLNTTQVIQMGFSLSGNDPTDFLKGSLNSYSGVYDRHLVGLMIEDHQSFISSVYMKVFEK